MKKRVDLTGKGRTALRSASSTAQPETDKIKSTPATGEVDIPPLEGGNISTLPQGGQGTGKEETEWEIISSALLRLPKAARREVIARLVLLNDSKGEESRDLEMWTDAVYQCLHATNASGELASVGPLPLKRLLGSVKNWAAVEDFMQKSYLGQLTVQKRQAVYIMLARQLVEYSKRLATHYRVPLTPKFVANNAAQIAGIFETEFPGYVRAGLAPMIADRMTEGKKEN